MTSLESLIGNDIEGVFQTTSPSLMYYYFFGEVSNTDKNVLPYGDYLVDAKFETHDESRSSHQLHCRGKCISL